MPNSGLAYQVSGPPPEAEGVHAVTLATADGDIRCRLQLANGERAVLWVFGAGGGLGGPAGGVYQRLGEVLSPEGVTSLELDYRRPARLEPCVTDVLTGLDYLADLGKRRVVLVGHSFGGAVVIEAGARRAEVAGVAALSSQTAGAGRVAEIAPRPLLLAHGEADEVLPPRCSRDLFAQARQPKQIILYPGCRHGLDQCREALDCDLLAWLRQVLPA
jgi:fermentation-respiration switch protein FrsA (DUF1100 family)